MEEGARTCRISGWWLLAWDQINRSAGQRKASSVETFLQTLKFLFPVLLWSHLLLLLFFHAHIKSVTLACWSLHIPVSVLFPSDQLHPCLDHDSPQLAHETPNSSRSALKPPQQPHQPHFCLHWSCWSLCCFSPDDESPPFSPWALLVYLYLKAQLSSLS